MKENKCGIKRMWEVLQHIDHEKVYTCLHVELAIKFHFCHWSCFKWTPREAVYVYLSFAQNDCYDSFYQVRIANGVINKNHQLMSSSILSCPPCACLKATLGDNQDTLLDTKYEFILINGNMDKEVKLQLDDNKQVVTPFGITTGDVPIV